MPRSALLAATFVPFVLALTGCAGTAGGPGEARDEPPAPADSETDPAGTGATEPATTSTGPSPAPPELAPPPIVLETAGGQQEGTQESYCITVTDESGRGTGICADTFDRDPKRLTVVRPGETVTISMPGATIRTNGEAAASVRPLGCHDRELERIPLGSEATDWAVDLEPGAYELQVFVRFEALDGSSGDSGASLGLLVDRQREPGIVKAKPRFFVCPPSEEG